MIPDSWKRVSAYFQYQRMSALYEKRSKSKGGRGCNNGNSQGMRDHTGKCALKVRQIRYSGLSPISSTMSYVFVENIGAIKCSQEPRQEGTE